MKVIFLDIDGVLNQMGEKPTPIRMVGDILTMADPEMVYRLNLIVDRTDAEIVLSSSWRHMPNWREMMAASGVVKKPLDCTPRHSQLSRGHNIRQWLDTHPEVMRYAILDDDTDMLPEQMPHFFRTHPWTGLTQEIADAVEIHLTSP